MAEQPTASRVYLDVPFSEKDTAKTGGARWDPKVKRWYDPHGATPALARWVARPPIPEVLPGEDRAFGDGLFVDLVPSSCWFTNVRSCVSEQDWERLRRPMLRRAGHRCEICGAQEDRAARQWLDLHERWDYDDHSGVQRLRRLIAVCRPCHEVTHFGLANVRGRTEEAFAHLRQVTGMNQDQAWAHVDAAEQVWLGRSERTWELDLSVLTGVGLTIQPPPAQGERAGQAERALRAVRTTPAAPVPPTPPPPAYDPRPAAVDTLAAALATDGWHGGPDDLARNAPGIGVVYEAARRRQSEGEGADRSWRIGADGEATVAEALAALTAPGRLDRLRRRPPAWRVLHSVPVGTGRGDIDHVLIGPPGVVTINTKHHRAGRLALDGEELIVNGRATDYIPKARREARRAGELLTSALTAVGETALAAQLRVQPVIAVVGGRVLVTNWSPGVAVVMTRQLTHTLSSMTAALDAEQVEKIYGIARHRAVWTRPSS